MSDLVFKKIQGELARAQRVLIVSHKNPDGDACGASLALWFYLKEKGYDTQVFLLDPLPSYFDFLPGVEAISRDISILQKNWDVAVVLDSSELAYAGLTRELFKSAVIINIDHHFTNTLFGQINFVDHRACSASELVYRLFKADNYAPDRRIATCLLTGILNDTGGFSNAATTAQSMIIASELIRYGARIDRINRNVSRNKSVEGLKLWGLVLSRFQINPRYDLAYTYVKESDFKDYRVSEEELDGLANFLNILADVSVAMFLTIGEKETKVNLRTTKDNMDVSRLAQYFGGGGHKKAAGFTVNWRVEEVDGELRVLG